VQAVVLDGVEVDSATAPAQMSKGGADSLVQLVLEPTPFYGESGGQVGDRGVLTDEGGQVLAEIIDVQKPGGELTVATGRLLKGKIARGQQVWAGYNPRIRRQTRAHHSATHLLHASLRKVLGDHVKQAGSLVDPERLRFDYAHFQAPSDAELAAVEEDRRTSSRLMRRSAKARLRFSAKSTATWCVWSPWEIP
jgi:alanyl-tRNA synthetase